MSDSSRGAPAPRIAELVRTARFQRGLAAVVLAGALYAVHAAALAPVEGFRFDDSYITLRYAENLAHHGVLSFNVDDRVNGFTSTLWTLLLAAAIRLGADAEQAMLVGSHLAGYLAAIAAALCARALGASRVASVLLAAIGLVFTAGFMVWTAPGMETPLVGLVYALLAASGFVVVPASREPVRRRVVAALIVLAALARPEGALFAAGAACIELAPVLRAEAWRDALARTRPIVIACAIVLAAFAIQWAYYGYPLPNTFYAKSSTPGLAQTGARDAAEFLRGNPVAVAPWIALAIAARPGSMRRRAYALLYALWFAAVLFVYARSGGDYMGFHRFYQPLAPIGMALLAWAVTLLTSGRDRLFALALAILFGSVGRETLTRVFPQNLGTVGSQTTMVEDFRAVGAAIGPTLRPDDVLAVRAAGVLPFAAHAPRVLDTLALNNPAIAHHNDVVYEVPGHQKEATVEQIRRWRPSVLVGHPTIESADRSGVMPAALLDGHWERYGYGYRCVPMADHRFTCFLRRE